MCICVHVHVYLCSGLMCVHVGATVLVLSHCTLPPSKTINRRCVEATVQTSVTLSARLNLVSHFDRKHYFYPDLPVSWVAGWKRREAREREGREEKGGEGRWGEGREEVSPSSVSLDYAYSISALHLCDQRGNGQVHCALCHSTLSSPIPLIKHYCSNLIDRLILFICIQWVWLFELVFCVVWPSHCYTSLYHKCLPSSHLMHPSPITAEWLPDHSEESAHCRERLP